jgi:hypothetical protein
MIQSCVARRADWGRTGLGVSIFLLVTLGEALILRGSPAAADGRSAALLTGAGTLAMAWIFTRPSGYPRWAMLGSAAALCAGLLLSAAFAPSASAWADDTVGTRWMFPWFYMVIGSGIPRPRTGICAPGHVAAGWMLVGIGVLFGLVLLVAPAIVAWWRG